MNNRLVHIFGLKRSGNHHIINMLSQNAFGEKKVVFNNDLYDWGLKPMDDASITRIALPEASNTAMILSYENAPLEKVSTFPTIRHEQSLLSSLNGNISRILIIRDPRNFFASWLKRYDNSVAAHENNRPILRVPFNEVRNMWVSYAKEALGDTRLLGDRTVTVNYDNWVTQKTYRDSFILHNFGIVNKDLGLNEVPQFAEGSSFDSTSLHGRGSEMDVLNRWEHYKNDERFNEFLASRELQELSVRLFEQSSNSIKYSTRHAKES